jgi:SPP1 family predicted phage head-tail adaptor
MDAGRLRHYVEIEDYVLVQDEAGDDIKVYSHYGFTWASIRTLRGRELFLAQQQFAASDNEIVIRYLAGVNEQMRVVHDGLYYNILNCDDVELRHKTMILLCETGISETK